MESGAWNEIPWGLRRFIALRRRGGRDRAAALSGRAWWDYEDPLPVAFAALSLSSEGAFYDVGANTGFYSVLLGRLDPRRTIRAFEPLPAAADACEENLRNVGRGDVVVERVAVSSAPGTATLFMPPTSFGFVPVSASLNEDFSPGGTESFTVSRETLDEAHRRFAGEQVALIKIDVEGAEYDVLLGARELMRTQRPIAAVEILPRAAFEQIDDLLREWGYGSLVLHPGLQVERGDRIAFHADAWNHLLVPVERLDEVCGLLEDARREWAAIRRDDGAVQALVLRLRVGPARLAEHWLMLRRAADSPQDWVSGEVGRARRLAGRLRARR